MSTVPPVASSSTFSAVPRQPRVLEEKNAPLNFTRSNTVLFNNSLVVLTGIEKPSHNNNNNNNNNKDSSINNNSQQQQFSQSQNQNAVAPVAATTKGKQQKTKMDISIAVLPLNSEVLVNNNNEGGEDTKGQKNNNASKKQTGWVITEICGRAPRHPHGVILVVDDKTRSVICIGGEISHQASALAAHQHQQQQIADEESKKNPVERRRDYWDNVQSKNLQNMKMVAGGRSPASKKANNNNKDDSRNSFSAQTARTSSSSSLTKNNNNNNDKTGFALPSITGRGNNNSKISKTYSGNQGGNRLNAADEDENNNNDNGGVNNHAAPQTHGSDIHVATLDGVRAWRAIPVRRGFPIAYASPYLLPDGRILLHGGLTGPNIKNSSILICDPNQGTTDSIAPDTGVHLRDHKCFLRASTESSSSSDQTDISYLILFAGISNPGEANGSVYLLPVDMNEVRRTGAQQFYSHVRDTCLAPSTEHPLIKVSAPEQWSQFESQNFAWEYCKQADSLVVVSAVADYHAVLNIGEILESKDKHHPATTSSTTEQGESDADENTGPDGEYESAEARRRRKVREQFSVEVLANVWNEHGQAAASSSSASGGHEKSGLAENGSDDHSTFGRHYANNNNTSSSKRGNEEQDDDDDDEDDANADDENEKSASLSKKKNQSSKKRRTSSTSRRNTLQGGVDDDNSGDESSGARKRKEGKSRHGSLALRHDFGEASVFDFTDNVASAASAVSPDGQFILIVSGWNVKHFNLKTGKLSTDEESAKIKNVARVIPAIPEKSKNKNSNDDNNDDQQQGEKDNNNNNNGSAVLVAANHDNNSLPIIQKNGRGISGPQRQQNQNNININQTRISQLYPEAIELEATRAMMNNRNYPAVAAADHQDSAKKNSATNNQNKSSKSQSKKNQSNENKSTKGNDNNKNKKQQSENSAPPGNSRVLLANIIFSALEDGTGSANIGTRVPLNGHTLFDLDMLLGIPKVVLQQLVNDSKKGENINNKDQKTQPLAIDDKKSDKTKDGNDDGNDQNDYSDDFASDNEKPKNDTNNNNNNNKKKPIKKNKIKTLNIEGNFIDDSTVDLFCSIIAKHPSIVQVVGASQEKTSIPVAQQIEQALLRNAAVRQGDRDRRAVSKNTQIERRQQERQDFNKSPHEVAHQRRERFMVIWEENVVRDEMNAAQVVYAAENKELLALLRQKAELENAVKEALQRKREDELMASLLEIEQEECSFRADLENQIFIESSADAREMRENHRTFLTQFRLFLRAKEQEQIQFMKVEKEKRAGIMNEEVERKAPMTKELRDAYKVGRDLNTANRKREEDRIAAENAARNAAEKAEALRKLNEAEDEKKRKEIADSTERRETQGRNAILQEQVTEEANLDLLKKKGEAAAQALYIRRLREQDRQLFGKKGLQLAVTGLEKNRRFVGDSVGSITIIEPIAFSSSSPSSSPTTNNNENNSNNNNILSLTAKAEIPPSFETNFRIDRDEITIDSWRKQKKQILKVTMKFTLTSFQAGVDRLILDTENFLVVPSSSSIASPITTSRASTSQSASKKIERAENVNNRSNISQDVFSIYTILISPSTFIMECNNTYNNNNASAILPPPSGVSFKNHSAVDDAEDTTNQNQAEDEVGARPRGIARFTNNEQTEIEIVLTGDVLNSVSRLLGSTDALDAILRECAPVVKLDRRPSSSSTKNNNNNQNPICKFSVQVDSLVPDVRRYKFENPNGNDPNITAHGTSVSTAGFLGKSGKYASNKSVRAAGTDNFATSTMFAQSNRGGNANNNNNSNTNTDDSTPTVLSQEIPAVATTPQQVLQLYAVNSNSLNEIHKSRFWPDSNSAAIPKTEFEVDFASSTFTEIITFEPVPDISAAVDVQPPESKKLMYAEAHDPCPLFAEDGLQIQSSFFASGKLSGLHMFLSFEPVRTHENDHFEWLKNSSTLVFENVNGDGQIFVRNSTSGSSTRLLGAVVRRGFLLPPNSASSTQQAQPQQSFQNNAASPSPQHHQVSSPSANAKLLLRRKSSISEANASVQAFIENRSARHNSHRLSLAGLYSLANNNNNNNVSAELGESMITPTSTKKPPTSAFAATVRQQPPQQQQQQQSSPSSSQVPILRSFDHPLIQPVTEIVLSRDATIQDLQKLVSSIGFSNNSRNPTETQRTIRVAFYSPALRLQYGLDLTADVECFDDPVEVDFGLGGGCPSTFHAPLPLPPHMANIARPFYFALFGQVIDVDTEVVARGSFLELEIENPQAGDYLKFIPCGGGATLYSTFELHPKGNVVMEKWTPAGINMLIQQQQQLMLTSNNNNNNTTANYNNQFFGSVTSNNETTANHRQTSVTTSHESHTNNNNNNKETTSATTSPGSNPLNIHHGNNNNIINNNIATNESLATNNSFAGTSVAAVLASLNNNNNNNNAQSMPPSNSNMSHNNNNNNMNSSLQIQELTAPKKVAVMSYDENVSPYKIRFDMEECATETFTKLLRCIEFFAPVSTAMFDKPTKRRIKVSVRILDSSKDNIINSNTKSHASESSFRTNPSGSLLAGGGDTGTFEQKQQQQFKTVKKRVVKTRKVKKTIKKTKQVEKIIEVPVAVDAKKDDGDDDFDLDADDDKSSTTPQKTEKKKIIETIEYDEEIEVDEQYSDVEEVEEPIITTNSREHSSSHERSGEAELLLSSTQKPGQQQKPKYISHNENVDSPQLSVSQDGVVTAFCDIRVSGPLLIATASGSSPSPPETPPTPSPQASFNNSADTRAMNSSTTTTSVQPASGSPTTTTLAAAAQAIVSTSSRVLYKEQSGWQPIMTNVSLGFDDNGWDGGSIFVQMINGWTSDDVFTILGDHFQQQQISFEQQQQPTETDESQNNNNSNNLKENKSNTANQNSSMNNNNNKQANLSSRHQTPPPSASQNNADGNIHGNSMRAPSTPPLSKLLRHSNGITLTDLEPGASSIFRRPIRIQGLQQTNHTVTLNSFSGSQQQQQQLTSNSANTNPNFFASSAATFGNHNASSSSAAATQQMRRIAGTMKRRRKHFAALRQSVRDEADESLREKLGLDDTPSTACKILNVDGKRIGVVHFKGNALWIGFDENLNFDKLSRKDMCSLHRSAVARVLKSIAFCNNSIAPRCLNKSIIVSACDGLQHSTTAVVDLQVLATDTVTEFSLLSLNPIVYRMNDPLHAKGLFRPFKDYVMSDPDTFYFNGQTLWVDVLAGGDAHSDQFGLLPVKEQEKLIRDQQSKGGYMAASISTNRAKNSLIIVDESSGNIKFDEVISESTARKSKQRQSFMLQQQQSATALIADTQNDHNNVSSSILPRSEYSLGIFIVDAPAPDEATTITVKFAEVLPEIASRTDFQNISSHDEAAELHPSLVTIDDVCHILNMITFAMYPERASKLTPRQLRARIGFGKKKADDGETKIPVQVQAPVLSILPACKDALVVQRSTAVAVLSKVAFQLTSAMLASGASATTNGGNSNNNNNNSTLPSGGLSNHPASGNNVFPSSALPASGGNDATTSSAAAAGGGSNATSPMSIAAASSSINMKNDKNSNSKDDKHSIEDKTLVREGKLTIRARNAGQGDYFSLQLKKLEGFLPPPKALGQTLNGTLHLPSGTLACRIASENDRKTVTLSFDTDCHITVKQVNLILKLLMFTCGTLDGDGSEDTNQEDENDQNQGCNNNNNNNPRSVFRFAATKSDLQEQAARKISISYESISNPTHIIKSAVSLRVLCNSLATATTSSPSSQPQQETQMTSLFIVHDHSTENNNNNPQSTTTSATGANASLTFLDDGKTTSTPTANNNSNNNNDTTKPNRSVRTTSKDAKKKDTDAASSSMKNPPGATTGSTVDNSNPSISYPTLPKLAFQKNSSVVMRNGNFARVLPQFTLTDVTPWLINTSPVPTANLEQIAAASITSSGGAAGPFGGASVRSPTTTTTTAISGSSQQQQQQSAATATSSSLMATCPLSFAVTIANPQFRDSLVFRNGNGDFFVGGEVAQTDVPSNATISALQSQQSSLISSFDLLRLVDKSASATAAKKPSGGANAAANKPSAVKVALIVPGSTNSVGGGLSSSINNNNNGQSVLASMPTESRLTVIPYPGIATAAAVEGILKGIGIRVSQTYSAPPQPNPDRQARRFVYIDTCVDGVAQSRSVFVVDVIPPLISVPLAPGMRHAPTLFVNTFSGAKTDIFPKLIVPSVAATTVSGGGGGGGSGNNSGGPVPQVFSGGATCVVTLNQPPKFFYLSLNDKNDEKVSLSGKSDIICDKKKVATLAEQTNKFTISFPKNTSPLIIQRVLRSIALESHNVIKHSTLQQQPSNNNNNGSKTRLELSSMGSPSNNNNHRRPSDVRGGSSSSQRSSMNPTPPLSAKDPKLSTPLTAMPPSSGIVGCGNDSFANISATSLPLNSNNNSNGHQLQVPGKQNSNNVNALSPTAGYNANRPIHRNSIAVLEMITSEANVFFTSPTSRAVRSPSNASINNNNGLCSSPSRQPRPRSSSEQLRISKSGHSYHVGGLLPDQPPLSGALSAGLPPDEQSALIDIALLDEATRELRREICKAQPCYIDLSSASGENQQQQQALLLPTTSSTATTSNTLTPSQTQNNSGSLPEKISNQAPPPAQQQQQQPATPAKNNSTLTPSPPASSKGNSSKRPPGKTSSAATNTSASAAPTPKASFSNKKNEEEEKQKKNKEEQLKKEKEEKDKRDMEEQQAAKKQKEDLESKELEEKQKREEEDRNKLKKAQAEKEKAEELRKIEEESEARALKQRHEQEEEERAKKAREEQQRIEAQATEKKRNEEIQAEAERNRKEHEQAEKQKKEHEEAEHKRKEHEEAEKKKHEHEEAEKKKKDLEEAELKKKEFEEAERKEKEHEEAERKKKDLEEAEKKKKDQEEAEKKKKEHEEAEKKRKEHEEAERKKAHQGDDDDFDLDELDDPAPKKPTVVINNVNAKPVAEEENDDFEVDAPPVPAKKQEAEEDADDFEI